VNFGKGGKGAGKGESAGPAEEVTFVGTSLALKVEGVGIGGEGRGGRGCIGIYRREDPMESTVG
jgi:hypothetical protein